VVFALLGCAHPQRDGRRGPLPVGEFVVENLSVASGEGVILGPALVFPDGLFDSSPAICSSLWRDA
jgi:hypothetical protein